MMQSMQTSGGPIEKPIQKPISIQQLQGQMAKAQDEILQLKIQLRDKNQALNDSLLTSNNLKKKMAQFVQENRRLEIKNAQLLKEIQQNKKIIQQNQNKPQEQLQKINPINFSQLNELQSKVVNFTQQISNLTSQISNLKSKIHQLQSQNLKLQTQNIKLSEDLKKSTAISTQFQTKYREETQKVSHLMIVMEQVQEESSNAKKFKDKTFQEEYNKLLSQIKKLQQKIKKLKAQNDKLKNQIYQNKIYDENQKEFVRQKEREMEKQKQKQKFQQKMKVLQNNYVKNICTYVLHHQQALKLEEVQKQLLKLKDREETLSNQKLTFQNDLKAKDEQINRFHWQVYELQKSLSQIKISQAGLKKSLEETKQKIYALIFDNNLHQAPNKSQSSKQLPNSNDIFDMLPQTKPIFQTPVPKAIEYVKRIASTMGVYWTEIYYELDNEYILDHSNIPIDIDEFLVYDWTRLKQVNFYNSQFDVEKWTRFAQNGKKFPLLDMVYLHGNSITFVKQEDLSKFKKLKSVIFNYTDETRGLNAYVQPLSNVQKNK